MKLLNVSHQPQRRQSDCLAACSYMALRYLNIQSNYEDLVRQLIIGPAGAPFRNLKLLFFPDVLVEIKSGTDQDLIGASNSQIPPVVFINTSEIHYWSKATGHAVVMIGFDQDVVYVNDPAFTTAPQQIPVDEFILAWMEMDQYFALISSVNPKEK